MEKVSIGRKENFRLNYTNFNNRRFDGETWIEVNKDVKDEEDRLCFEIANSFFDMGIKIKTATNMVFGKKAGSVLN
jgi:hypothetical protein